MTSTSASATPTSAHWIWRGQSVHYVKQGEHGQPLLLVHGFGASTDHWRKNIPELAQYYQVYAIDLLGFGRSAKPNWDYRTEIWRDQLRDFCQQVVRRPVVAIGNSLGGYVVLSFAAEWPEWIRGVVLLNAAGSFSTPGGSSKGWKQWLSSLVSWGLRQRPMSYLLFQYLRQPHVIRAKLKQVYYDPATVTDQLVEDIRRPSLDPGAADVFVSLMRGVQKGRYVDELLRSLVRPLLLIWGERDPWMQARERSKLYRAYCPQLVEHFLEAGHCPHDERPEWVNPLIRDWIETGIPATTSPPISQLKPVPELNT
ncbi:MAG: alpha/beta fold hydrolase [Cyanobacteriota bacterium]